MYIATLYRLSISIFVYTCDHHILAILCLVGGANWANLEVAVRDLAVWRVGLDIFGLSGSNRAFTASNTWKRSILVGRVGAVEPEHLCRMVYSVSITLSMG